MGLGLVVRARHLKLLETLITETMARYVDAV